MPTSAASSIATAKPANIKITPAGQVKLLDIGLAKTADDAPASSVGTRSPFTSPTISMGMTHAGTILGTAAYMAPEQARGKPIDRRADIWAFGAVFYEMLSGRGPFDGETVTDVLSGVISRDPDWNALPDSTPPHIRRLIERCLRKEVRTRLQAIGEARIAVDEPPPAPPTAAAAATPCPPQHALWLGAGAAIVLGAAGLAWGILHRAKPPTLTPVHWTYTQQVLLLPAYALSRWNASGFQPGQVDVNLVCVGPETINARERAVIR